MTMMVVEMDNLFEILSPNPDEPKTFEANKDSSIKKIGRRKKM